MPDVAPSAATDPFFLDNATALPNHFLTLGGISRDATTRRTLPDVLSRLLPPALVARMTADPCRFSTAGFLGEAHDAFSVRCGSNPLALKYGTIDGTLEEIGFPAARNLELSDDLPAEARGAYEDRDFAYALSRCRSNFKSVFDRFAGVATLENLLAQQRIDEVASLDLMAACIIEICFYNKRNSTTKRYGKKRNG